MTDINNFDINDFYDQVDYETMNEERITNFYHQQDLSTSENWSSWGCE